MAVVGVCFALLVKAEVPPVCWRPLAVRGSGLSLVCSGGGTRFSSTAAAPALPALVTTAENTRLPREASGPTEPLMLLLGSPESAGAAARESIGGYRSSPIERLLNLHGPEAQAEISFPQDANAGPSRCDSLPPPSIFLAVKNGGHSWSNWRFSYQNTHFLPSIIVNPVCTAVRV